MRGDRKTKQSNLAINKNRAYKAHHHIPFEFNQLLRSVAPPQLYLRSSNALHFFISAALVARVNIRERVDKNSWVANCIVVVVEYIFKFINIMSILSLSRGARIKESERRFISSFFFEIKRDSRDYCFEAKKPAINSFDNLPTNNAQKTEREKKHHRLLFLSRIVRWRKKKLMQNCLVATRDCDRVNH